MEKIREGYKMTELGEIPEEWEVKELNDITSVITKGTTPTTYGYDFEDEGINFIKIESINDMKGTLLEETFSKISEECHKKLSRSILEEDDILFAIAGATIGKCAITTKECLPANTNQALAIIRLNQNIDSKFIFHQLRGPLIQNKIENLKTNTAQPNLNLKQIGEFTILLPTLKEQQKLSLILNCVDEQIEITDNLIEKTTELKKGLMQKLLTKGIGHSRFKDTEIGRIPEEWELRRLGDICDFKQGFQISRSGQITEQQEGYIRYLYITDFFSDKNKLYVKDDEKFYYIKNEDITIANTGNTCGKAFRGASGVLSNNMFKIFNKKELLDNEFLWQYLNSLIYWEQLKKYFNTAGQPHVGHKNMSELKIALPNNTYEQQKISLILLSVDEQIDQYESKKGKLQELKKGLMQKLLTGSIRVKV